MLLEHIKEEKLMVVTDSGVETCYLILFKV